MDKYKWVYPSKNAYMVTFERKPRKIAFGCCEISGVWSRKAVVSSTSFLGACHKTHSIGEQINVRRLTSNEALNFIVRSYCHE